MKEDFSLFVFWMKVNVGTKYYRTNSLYSAIGYLSDTGQSTSEANDQVPDNKSQSYSSSTGQIATAFLIGLSGSGTFHSSPFLPDVSCYF